MSPMMPIDTFDDRAEYKDKPDQEIMKGLEASVKSIVDNLKKSGVLQDATQKEIFKTVEKLKKNKSIEELFELKRRLTVCGKTDSKIEESVANKSISRKAAPKLRESLSDVVNNTSLLTEDLASSNTGAEQHVWKIFGDLRDIPNIHEILNRAHPQFKTEVDQLKKQLYNDPSKAREIREKAEKVEEKSRTMSADNFFDEKLGS